MEPKGGGTRSLAQYSEYSTALNPYTNPSSHHLQHMAQVCPSLVFKARSGAMLMGG